MAASSSSATLSTKSRSSIASGKASSSSSNASSSQKWWTPIAPLSPELNGFTEDPRAKLEPQEQEMYEQIVAHFSRNGYTLPDLEQTEGGGALTEKEKFWLSRDCLLRYLRASKWNTHVAAQKLESTLKWRREYGLYDPSLTKNIENEAVTGKHIFFGYDTHGRPAFYAFPSRQNTDSVDGHVKFAFWMVERGIELMGPGVETLHILLNFAERAAKPNYSEATTLINIMQAHYPERLGICSVINVPFLINAFLKLVLPFLDPRTRQKMTFNQSVVKEGLFDRDMLMREWEGTREFEYVHEKYWPALLQMCEENVERWMKRWRELGAKVGISEWDYKMELGVEVAKETPQANGEAKQNGQVTAQPTSTEVQEAKPLKDIPAHPSPADPKSH